MRRERIEEVDFAVDEHIWGHRLYDEQLPHLTLLEFLGILRANSALPLRHDADGRVRYRPAWQVTLRALLFNNPNLDAIRLRREADADKWRSWEESFRKDAGDLAVGSLGHLREAFLSFEDFAKAVALLRSSAYEANSNKRWSSKFVFPYGPDALYEDIRVKSDGSASNDRRFFGRTGELLYLMLCRSARASELGPLLISRLFDPSAPLNRLARAMQGQTQPAPNERTSGYLPHASLPRFDRMAEDWIAILSRDMPAGDAVDHLVVSAGLNLLLYFLERGKAAAGDNEPVEFLCEVVSRDRSKVRALSADSWQANQAASLRAVRAFVESAKGSTAWTEALGAADPSAACASVMRDLFQWPAEEKEIGTAPDRLVSLLAEAAEKRHGQHFGKIHSSWSRAVGLSSRRLSRRMRYAPNDRLLKTLVVTVVEGRMEYGEFLREIHRRYGIVVGEAEGAALVRENVIDQEDLSNNRARLESRLLGLGLLRRLSDACSFVENPFWRGAA